MQHPCGNYKAGYEPAKGLRQKSGDRRTSFSALRSHPQRSFCFAHKILAHCGTGATHTHFGGHMGTPFTSASTFLARTGRGCSQRGAADRRRCSGGAQRNRRHWDVLSGIWLKRGGGETGLAPSPNPSRNPF